MPVGRHHEILLEMAQGDVAMVRAAVEAFNRGDLDAVLESASPDCVYDLSRAVGPLHGVYRLEEMRDAMDELTGLWESSRIEPDEFIEAGEHIVVPWTFYAAGRDGIEVQARTTWVFTVRDGAIARICMYQERGEALEAASLSE